MNQTAIRNGIAAALAAVAFSAHAGPTLIQNNWANAGSPADVTVAGASSNNGNYQVGEFTGTFGGASFVSYCVDLLQFFSFGVAYDDYTPMTGAAALGAKATQIGQLLTASGGFGLSTPSKSAAVQAGIWEILYETGSGFNLGSGSFTAVPGSVSTADLTTVNGYLANLGSYSATQFTALISPNHQDFITPTPVPEPSTYALMAVGLAALGAVARRRSSAR